MNELTQSLNITMETNFIKKFLIFIASFFHT